MKLVKSVANAGRLCIFKVEGAASFCIIFDGIQFKLEWQCCQLLWTFSNNRVANRDYQFWSRLFTTSAANATVNFAFHLILRVLPMRGSYLFLKSRELPNASKFLKYQFGGTVHLFGYSQLAECSFDSEHVFTI